MWCVNTSTRGSLTGDSTSLSCPFLLKRYKLFTRKDPLRTSLMLFFTPFSLVHTDGILFEMCGCLYTHFVVPFARGFVFEARRKRAYFACIFSFNGRRCVTDGNGHIGRCVDVVFGHRIRDVRRTWLVTTDNNRVQTALRHNIDF